MAMSGPKSMSVQVRESYKSKNYRPRTKARTSERRTIPSSSMKMVEYQYGTSLVGTSSEEFKSAREKEKSEMRDLNARLAHYIEVSRYNDALNKNLVEEMENLKATGRRGSDSMKNMYETELEQLRRLLDEGEREKAELRRQMEEKENQVDDLQAENRELEDMYEDNLGRLRRQDEDLATCEAQRAVLERKVENCLADKERDRRNVERLKAEVCSLRNDLGVETVSRIDNQNQCQTLREELEFVKDLHAQELKELGTSRDPFDRSREWWSSEFANCIKDIQDEYDSRLEAIRDDLESHYSLKIHQVQTGAARNELETSMFRDKFSTLQSTKTDMQNRVEDLENSNARLNRHNQDLQRELHNLQREYDKLLVEKDAEMNQLRTLLENTLTDLQSITDRNMSLQLEIMAYRKLLENEENRIGIVDDSLHHSFTKSDPGIGIVDDSLHYSFPKSDSTQKTTYQRSAKGPITITRVDVDGLFLEIENTNVSKEQNLRDWRIIQNADGSVFEYTFPQYNLPPASTLRICPEGSSEETDLVWTGRDLLSTGTVVTTSLLDAEGDEMATFTQKTVFTV